MRTEKELDEALSLLDENWNENSRVQADIIMNHRTEEWVFEHYVRGVSEEDRNEDLYFAARDAARFVAGKIQIDELVTVKADKQDIPETALQESGELLVPSALLRELQNRIERLEIQVRILKGYRQRRSYQRAMSYEENDFITQTEAYHYIGCSQSTIIKWTRKGMLKGYRKGQHLFYKRSELDASPVVQNFKNINHGTDNRTNPE